MSSALDESIPTAEMLASTFARPESASATLMAVDVGSSGIRASLFDEKGRELTSAQRFTRRTSSYADIQSAPALTEVVFDVIDELLAPVPLHAEIELIAISCFWHSLLGVNADGLPTTPILDWRDPSAHKAARALRARLPEKAIHSRTGCRLHPSYWPAKLLWLKNERPDQFAATERWLSFSDYLTNELVGESLTSVCMASGSGLLNQATCDWDEQVLQELQISREQLPRIAATSISNVELKPAHALRWLQLQNARLCPAIGDGAANSVGSGCVTSDKLALMVGTSGAARVVSEGQPPAEIPSALWCYRVDQRRVILGGALSDGGGLYEHMRRTLCADDAPQELEAQLAQMKADDHGLTVLPFWAGERSTGWTPNAAGGILGLTMQTKPVEILRAAMEAVAYRFAAIVDALSSVTSFSDIVASGNALQSSPVWLQIICDVIGREIVLTETREASTRGAALLALEAAGKIQLNDKTDLQFGKIFDPDFSQHEKYQAARERQEKFYDAVVPLFE